MTGRPRCASCKLAFTPDYRNRTKIKGRQRVCAECGSVVGHQKSQQRYDSSPAEPGSTRRRTAVLVRQDDGAPGAPVPKSEVGETSFSGELASQIRINSTRIADLLIGTRKPDGCGPFKPLQVSNDAKSSQEGNLMAEGCQTRSR